MGCGVGDPPNAKTINKKMFTTRPLCATIFRQSCLAQAYWTVPRPTLLFFKSSSAPVFVNVCGVQESIPRNRFRQPMQPGGPIRQIGLSCRPARLVIDSWTAEKVYKYGLQFTSSTHPQQRSRPSGSSPTQRQRQACDKNTKRQGKISTAMNYCMG